MVKKQLWGWVGILVFGVLCQGVFGVEAPPGHQGLTLPCETCHTTDSWTSMKNPIAFDHSETGFPLEDRHSRVDCASCHVNGDFVRVQSTCQTCHTDVHRAENGQDCQRCHDAQGWIPTQAFDLHQMTRFPLVGMHATVDCQTCHVNQQQNEFTGISTDCYACHVKDYETATTPNHTTAQFGRDCEQCHPASQAAWRPSIFDHNQTSFALSGAHSTADCASCHTNGVFAGTPNTCYACHQLDYEGVETPNHVVAGFDTQCETCHTDGAWVPSTFDHNQTGFALSGAHSVTDCASCHTNGVFAGTPNDCYACHQQDYENAKSPNHAIAGFDTNCETCHTNGVWEPSTFDHNQTGFALTGAHTTTDCSGCHVDGVFEGTPKECYLCHQTDYENAVSPNHLAAQFDTDCLTCHTDAAWSPSTFDHNQTGFELVGAHQNTDCASCHSNGVFEGTPTDCFTCHQLDYEQTKNPNHVLAQFSSQCLDCHTQTAWEPALFDHNQTRFALTGRHSSVSCESCHANGVFANTSMDCFSCHQSDFQQARDPNHVSARFPETCEQCHNTSRWEPADFNHRPFFPIYSGEHRGEWDTCADCHTEPSNFKVFSCLNCHEHSKARMDREHRGRRNYVYESQACYDCHPDGDD